MIDYMIDLVKAIRERNKIEEEKVKLDREVFCCTLNLKSRIKQRIRVFVISGFNIIRYS